MLLIELLCWTTFETRLSPAKTSFRISDLDK
jgi:hypothetical protein